MTRACRRYLNNDSCVPLILHGRAGCGKSSLVAKVAEQCGNWLNNYQLSVRFIGQSAVDGPLPGSS